MNRGEGGGIVRKKTLAKKYIVSYDQKRFIKERYENISKQFIDETREIPEEFRLTYEEFLNAVKKPELYDFLMLTNNHRTQEWLREMFEKYRKKYEDYIKRYGMKVRDSQFIRIMVDELRKKEGKL